MQQLLIVYHSQSGTCAELARAACEGAGREEGVNTLVRRSWDAGADDLCASGAVLLVAAENSATLCGGMKDFLDRTFYPAIAAGLVIPYGLLLSAGNDGRGALAQVQRIFRGIPFPEAVEPAILRGEISPAHREQALEMGEAFAAGLAMGVF